MVDLYCSNHKCQAPNPLESQFCRTCQTPMVRRYLRLWEPMDLPEKTLLADRYLVQPLGWLLDTKPHLPPCGRENIPEAIVPYLKLSPLSLYLPQVYGVIASTPTTPRNWLLEYGYLPTVNSPQEFQNLLPPLALMWPEALPFQQLTWLWQWAKLWQPLGQQRVVSSLLQEDLLRVQGGLLQLSALRLDRHQTFTLKDLGECWHTLIDTIQPPLKPWFREVVGALISEAIATPQALVEQLDQALESYVLQSPQHYTRRAYTQTDAGPSRDHNEDACFPPGGQVTGPTSQAFDLVVVCDGIGGHDHGEVASRIAIEVMGQSLRSFSQVTPTPATIGHHLQELIAQANDRISRQNDAENRHERHRMGTTLVTALTHHHETYLAHVGDSRIYWISRHGCYQLTFDDDLASREVRLGYALYRDAIGYPNAGALVQALGMVNARNLYPTVQRLIFAEDGILLLCSDGLSDYDRLEQHWQTTILPLLDQPDRLEEVGQALIEIANRENGHDNVTIALLVNHIQPSPNLEQPLSLAGVPPAPDGETAFAPVEASAAPEVLEQWEATDDPAFVDPGDTEEPRRSPLVLALATVLVLAMVGVMGFFMWKYAQRIFSSGNPVLPSGNDRQFEPPQPKQFQVGTFLRTTKAIVIQTPDPEEPADPPPSITIVSFDTLSTDLPDNTIIQVVALDFDQDTFQGKICSIPPATDSHKPGELVTLSLADTPVFTILDDPTPTEMGPCTPLTAPERSPAESSSITPPEVIIIRDDR